MPRDATFRVVPHHHWNAYNHHHSDNSDDDNKRCHNNHHDGNGCAFNDKEWPGVKPFEKKKIGLDSVHVMRKMKWHIDQRRRSADSDKVGPSVGREPVAALPLRIPR